MAWVEADGRQALAVGTMNWKLRRGLRDECGRYKKWGPESKPTWHVRVPRYLVRLAVLERLRWKGELGKETESSTDCEGAPHSGSV